MWGISPLKVAKLYSHYEYLIFYSIYSNKGIPERLFTNNSDAKDKFYFEKKSRDYSYYYRDSYRESYRDSDQNSEKEITEIKYELGTF